MKQKYLNKIQNKISEIYKCSKQINYLVKNVVYNADNENEAYILGEMAMSLSERIKNHSLDISSYFAK